ncbi:MAG: hypothetical protein ABIA93_05780 [Candidatus Woesearchaeota archaeon]
MDSQWRTSRVKGKILYKLSRAGKFHHSHTALENLTKGFPSDMKGAAKECVNELIKEGIIFIKKTNYGVHVSVNTEKHEQILRYIDEFLMDD